MVEWGAEPAEKGGTLREGLTEVGQSTRELRLSSGVWIERPCLPTAPG